jgi:hypothetical protein
MTDRLTVEELVELEREFREERTLFGDNPTMLQLKTVYLGQLLAMARRLLEADAALKWLDEEGWTSPRYAEAKDRLRAKGRSTLSTDECVAFATELGWKGLKP